MANITTKREKPIMAHNGFMYSFDKRSSDDGKFWRCLKTGCLGRIKTDSNDVFVEFRNALHSHPANPKAILTSGEGDDDVDETTSRDSGFIVGGYFSLTCISV